MADNANPVIYSVVRQLMYFVYRNDNLTFRFYFRIRIGYRYDSRCVNITMKMVTKCLVVFPCRHYLVVYSVSGGTLTIVMMPSHTTILSIYAMLSLDALHLNCVHFVLNVCQSSKHRGKRPLEFTVITVHQT